MRNLERIKQTLLKINKLMAELKRMSEIDKVDWDAVADANETQVLKLEPLGGQPTHDPEQQSDEWAAEMERKNRANFQRMERERLAKNKRTLKQYKIKGDDK